MESRISLALATKLRMMFEQQDRYLTFPLGTGFSYRYLDFMKDPAVSKLTLQEQSNHKGDFARLLNLIPADSSAYSPDAGQFLWDAVENAIKGSRFAQSGLSEPENKQLEEAVDFLTDVRKLEDGSEIPVNSAAVNRYYEYKTLFDQAEATYLDEKITVQSSSGPEGDRLKQQWAAYREKQLLDLKTQADVDWMNLGFKEKVKNALQVRNDLEPKKFLERYRDAYLHEISISEIPDLNAMGIRTCTTFFSPLDTFEPTLPWTRITLTKSEIATLVQQAPADLKTIFNEGQGSEDIEAVSLEYNNVAVLRPWHKAEFFGSRYWRFNDDALVCDGNTPRHGTIPAYVNSMLVVRNVVVTRKKTMQQNPIILPILIKLPMQTYKIKPVALYTGTVVRPSASTKPVRADMAATAKPNPAMAPRAGAAMTAKPTAKSSFAMAAPSAKQAQTMRPVQAAHYSDVKYAGLAIKSPVITIPEKRPDPPKTTEELVTESFSFDGVIVLAYVCKRLPKSPNPDLALKWA